MLNFSKSDSWVVLSPIEQRIKEKIERVGTPLKDWDIRINYGIKTGFNDAFIIDGKKRKELIEQDPKSEEVIRPILRGRDIKRYSYDFADLWLLFIPWHFPLHKDPSIKGASQEAEKAFEAQYPAVYNHLLGYKTDLSNRNQSETGIRYEWYALQRWGANYWEDFSKQKIVWIELTDHPNFCLDDKGYLINNTVFFITGEHLPYILAFLNSKLCEWYFTKIAATSGAGTRRWIKIYIEQICIPQNVQANIEKELESLISQAQELKGNKTEKSEILNQIDEKIFGLFDLSEVEVKAINKTLLEEN